MANKAIIEVSPRGGIFSDLRTAVRKIGAKKTPQDADYHLGFESAALLFSELTPQRLALLEELKRCGACSIYALAKTLKRNYSNVHQDVTKLIEHGLIGKNEQGQVYVPWEEIQINVTFREEKAA